MYSAGYALYSVAVVLYLLAEAVAGPLICVCAWRAVGQARRLRLAAHLRWLTPLAIGTTVTLAAIALAVGSTVLRSRSPAVMALMYLLSALSTPFRPPGCGACGSGCGTCPPRARTRRLRTCARAGECPGSAPPPRRDRPSGDEP